MIPSIVGNDKTLRSMSELAYNYSLWTRRPATGEVLRDLRILETIAQRGIPTLEEALGRDGELRGTLEGVEGGQQALKRMMIDATYLAHMKELYGIMSTHFPPS